MKIGAMLAMAAVAGLSADAALAHNHGISGLFDASSLTITEYDGITDDLLSGGLGATGLQGQAPAFADPLDPTPAELRRRAILGNYQGVVDMVNAGGYGLFWGPGSNGGPDLIAGTEYKASFRAGSHHGNTNNITMVVQIPADFDQAKRCILMAPPSGSRGVYGGIAVGEWGLFQGCAVAMGGKGSGTGFHLLGEESAAYAVNNINGIAGSVEEIGPKAQFMIRNNRNLREFSEEYPNRFATKHAHSQINPEQYWGEYALRSVEFALWALNDHFKTNPGRGKGKGVSDVAFFAPKNTIIIAAGVSNGAGVALHALEDDTEGLIDGLVVSEPSANPAKGNFVIAFGDDDPFDPAGQTLYDNIAMMGLYAGCAALAPSIGDTAPLNIEPIGAPSGSRANRCDALYAVGLLKNPDPAEALAFLHANGYDPAQDWGVPSIEALNFWRTLNITYANSYGRFAVWDRLCGMSYGSSDASGAPVAFTEEAARALFSDSSGIPTTTIAEDAVNSPIAENLAISSFGMTDLNIDSALCFRYLSTGDPSDLGAAPTVRDVWNHKRVARGGWELQTTGNTHGKPAIVIHGRQDSLVFPNFQSRAYYALNQEVEGATSNLRYWEVTPAQHFDTFISSFFIDPVTRGAQFVPLHFYLTEGLEVMMNHLTSGTPLPPAQVIRADARGVVPYTAADVGTKLPLPSLTPAASDQITFAGGMLSIPD